LKEAGYTDFDLYYDEFGKPHLNDGKHISISHSHEFSAIMLSDQNIGIDLELQREKIIKIADKFASSEFEFLNQNDLQEYTRKLTVIWGAKEAIFKIRNEAGISFKDHIQVAAFEINAKQTLAQLRFGKIQSNYAIFFEEIENFTLVYAFEK
jgi:phosphopantetheinyl transferase